jgi:hypothetical protein
VYFAQNVGLVTLSPVLTTLVGGGIGFTLASAQIVAIDASSEINAAASVINNFQLFVDSVSQTTGFAITAANDQIQTWSRVFAISLGVGAHTVDLRASSTGSAGVNNSAVRAIVLE